MEEEVKTKYKEMKKEIVRVVCHAQLFSSYLLLTTISRASPHQSQHALQP
jgi:hypothetical protein